ncbi:hypothetical protein BG454_13620 [Roseinatronobacter bogoriensis subsp. barguzinensis]|uniref:Uncharacterized protein n=1 Tax=Roseinatronobacter bogoriensis subsp. barguzinensis TaxID=441209 RepID=A0A2K8KBA7_9RHOB|nr:hypothetical protein BG454_13620 [Rhodobaca barguzinensis]
MLAKSLKDQIVAQVAAKSPCRGGGPAMRGGALRLVSAPVKDCNALQAVIRYLVSGGKHELRLRW